MELGKALKAWRKRARMSQEQAARALLVSLATYQSWELGRRSPDGENVKRVEKVLASG